MSVLRKIYLRATKWNIFAIHGLRNVLIERYYVNVRL
jgi:hypothetical protein